MVRVLANGEIVADNDPRVGSSGQNQTKSPQENSARRRGAVNHNDEANAQVAQGPSIFSRLNNQLAGLGIPTWHAGPYPVEPIASLGFVLSLIFFGFGGLIFSGFLFFAVKYSQMGLGNGRTVQMPGFLNRLGFGGNVGGQNQPGRPSQPVRPSQPGGQAAGQAGGRGGFSGVGNRLGDS